MTELAEEDGLSKLSTTSRRKQFALATAMVVPTVISMVSAAMAGYFILRAGDSEPPADLSKLAVSILQSHDASPQMRAWAAAALGIPSDIPMDLTTGSTTRRKPAAQPMPLPKVPVAD